MRLPFPERIPLMYAFCFAAILSAIQLMEGTNGLFSLCCFLFIVIATATFNAAGGFSRTSGSYVFFYAVLGAIVGLVWKAVLGESADSNLESALTTIEVYVAGISAMLVAVYISRKLTRKRALLGNILLPENEQNATIGCMIVGVALTTIEIVVPHDPGSLLSALSQLDHLLPLAVLLGVRHQIKQSGGTRSINLTVLIAFMAIFFVGIVSFSKEGMLTPFLCWLVAASSMRYRVSAFQIAIGGLIAIFIFQVLVPYSQYGRVYRSDSLSDNVENAISLLSQPGYVREQYEQEEVDSEQSSSLSYYNTPQGFFDRLEMISMDSRLINLTEQGNVFGLSPIWAYFGNMIPHFFWPNKPRLYYQTMYAQEIGGILPETDTTTGISFTPSAEAFHLDRWVGVFVVAPILWCMLFTLFDSLCGDVRKAPWGLLVIPLFAHAAPETGLGGVTYLMSFSCLSIIFAALITAYFLPIVGTLVAGPENTGLRRTLLARGVPRRIADVRSSEI